MKYRSAESDRDTRGALQPKLLVAKVGYMTLQSRRAPVIAALAALVCAVCIRHAHGFVPQVARPSTNLGASLVRPELRRSPISSGVEFRRNIAPSSRGDVRRAMGLEEGLDAFGTYFITFAKDVNYGTLFSLSLFPYLLFLRNIWNKEDNPYLPSSAKWAFASLLIFVVSTIIGGIFCKVVYDDMLANIDYVHGVAESLLGVTNITLAMIFYRALEAAKRENGGQRPEKWR